MRIKKTGNTSASSQKGCLTLPKGGNRIESVITDAEATSYVMTSLFC